MRKIISIAQEHPKKILAAAILLYIAVFSSWCFWKYDHYLYNNMDLAIFNQAFFNTSMGDWFSLSIHPHSYLGDHLAPLMLIWVPLYSLFRSPIFLLVLQTVFLALPAVPVYLIARNAGLKQGFSLFFSLAWLLNPFVQNMNLFEFHMIPFSIFFILFAFYFYQKERFIPFMCFILLALSAREDVALFCAMFSLLKMIDLSARRTSREKFLKYQLKSLKNKWVWGPFLLSAGYFILAMAVISGFNPDGSYKFLYYYSWLGGSGIEILKNIIIHPLAAAGHIFSPGAMQMFMGLLLPFLALPLLKPKYLLLSLLPLLQMLLTGQGGSTLVLSTHYSALLVPSLFIASIYAVSEGISGKKILFILSVLKGNKKKEKIILNRSPLLFILLSFATVYSMLALGPSIALAAKAVREYDNKKEIKDIMLSEIPDNAPIAATYEFLPKLSGRPNLYSLNYAFLGKTQYAYSDYELPRTDYLLIDTDDLITYKFQYSDMPVYSPFYEGGPNRIIDILREGNFGVRRAMDSLILFERDAPDKKILHKIMIGAKNGSAPIASGGGMQILEVKKGDKQEFSTMDLQEITIKWKAEEEIKKDYLLKIAAAKNGKTVHLGEYAIGYGIQPTSKWHTDETMETTYFLSLPKKSGNYDLSLEIEDADGTVALDKIGYSIRRASGQKQILEMDIDH